MADRDYKTDFPDGLPWLTVMDLPMNVAGNGAAALAAHIGLPSASAWKWHLEWSADVGHEVSASVATVIADGGYRADVPDGVDRGALVHLRDVEKPDVVRVLDEIATVPPQVRVVMEGILGDVIGSPGTCVIAVRHDGCPGASGILAFHRYVDIDGDTVNLVIAPILVVGSDTMLSIAALGAAFQSQVQSDLECLVNGIWLAGVPATVACHINVPVAARDQYLNEHLSGLVDVARDTLFGSEGWYAPDHADWDAVHMAPTALIELEHLPADAVLQ